MKLPVLIARLMYCYHYYHRQTHTLLNWVKEYGCESGSSTLDKYYPRLACIRIVFHLKRYSHSTLYYLNMAYRTTWCSNNALHAHIRYICVCVFVCMCLPNEFKQLSHGTMSQRINLTYRDWAQPAICEAHIIL